MRRGLYKQRGWPTARIGVACLLLAVCANDSRAADAKLPPTSTPDAKALELFEKKVRPVLVQRCFDCHGPDSAEEGGLRVDSINGLLRGGRSGPALQPGRPRESLLILAINHDAHVHMPPKKKLPAAEIADLMEWVKRGAPWPDAHVTARPIATEAIERPFSEAERSFWAFRTPEEPVIPAVRKLAWCQSTLDRLVLARLEANGLSPAPPAAKRTLIRRATFDLHGLPPTLAEIEAFLADGNPDAFAKVVDRLLASPRYGERWGRHWLDVVRYSDSNGMDDNLLYADAWRYRDYIIAAFNQDKPYDQFVREQIAGDLLPPAHPDRPHDGVIATAFLTIGPKMLAEDDPVKQQMDIVDDQIDALGKAFLGLTLGCARCHDHKFDPLPTSDYYALAGIFKSTKVMLTYRVDSKWKSTALGTAEVEAQLSALEREIDRLDKIVVLSDRSKMTEAERKRLSEQLATAIREYSAIPKAMAVRDGRVENLRVFLRGNHLQRGQEAPRRFPRILAGDRQPPLLNKQSGRLELARWLTEKQHPLTSRVMVNRIWQGHFGRGIVPSPDNFGRLGERPDNQPLLDWLARRFVESGWSVKALHRVIMLSSTYQQNSSNAQHAAHSTQHSAQVDPENRLLWRMNRRRLEAEALRDALLAVSGMLDDRMGGTLLKAKDFDNLSVGDNKKAITYDSNRRSVYLPVLRGAVYDVFQAFDFPDPAVVNGKRTATTVAPQALFMMNSELVAQATQRWADNLLRLPSSNDAERLRIAYEKSFGRPPGPDETDEWLRYLRQFDKARPANTNPQTHLRLAWQSVCRILFSCNEFLNVD